MRLPSSHKAMPLLIGTALLGIGIGAMSWHALPSQPTVVNLNQTVVTQLNLPLFHSIVLNRKDRSNQTVNITVRIGDEQHVSIVSGYGGDAAVRTRVVDGTLHLLLNRETSFAGPLRINLASPRLRKITMDGAGDLQVSGGIRSASMHLEATRGARITAQRIGTRQLFITARRGGQVTVAGKTTHLQVQAVAGTIIARDLSAENASVSSLDQGRVEVKVSDSLEAFARHKSTIIAAGKSRKVRRDLDPSSSLKVL